MTTLITGGNGNLANSLKKYVDGDYYGKDMLDLADRNCLRNLHTYDVLIHTATGSSKINEPQAVLKLMTTCHCCFPKQKKYLCLQANKERS